MRCSTKIPPPLAPVLSVVHGLQNTFVMNVHHTTLLNALARTRVFFGASAPWEIGSVTGAPFGWGGGVFGKRGLSDPRPPQMNFSKAHPWHTSDKTLSMQQLPCLQGQEPMADAAILAVAEVGACFFA